MKTNVERVLDYLWSASPQGATNAQIREATGIEPHQQIYMITQDLQRKGKIARRRDGHERVFFVGVSPDELLQSPDRAALSTPLPRLNAAQFEDLARQVFSQRFGAVLRLGVEIVGNRKERRRCLSGSNATSWFAWLRNAQTRN